ncbi:hypothetical protein R1flu_008713 [Riccia fluitans]|uniref:Uncharacterized protein n=1 Tax=Riccia fluitans TaxID=41844 RepID=A0ABD1YCR2_9MARC
MPFLVHLYHLNGWLSNQEKIKFSELEIQAKELLDLDKDIRSKGGEDQLSPKYPNLANSGSLIISVTPEVDKVLEPKGETPEELPRTSSGPPLPCLHLPAGKELATKTSREKPKREVQEVPIKEDTPPKTRRLKTTPMVELSFQGVTNLDWKEGETRIESLPFVSPKGASASKVQEHFQI